MTIHAIPHGQIHRADSNGLVRNISVAGGAVHSCANVRRVVEPHVRRMAESINALPGDFFAPVQVGGYFFDFRPIRRDHSVADHASLDTGNPCLWAFLRSGVAIGSASQPVCDVDLMCEGDGLDRRRSQIEKIAKRFSQAAMGRSENG